MLIHLGLDSGPFEHQHLSIPCQLKTVLPFHFFAPKLDSLVFPDYI